MRGQRQFAHLVEEQRALISRAEVTRRVVDGTRIGALDVSEQLRVDGSFWNGAAVDGEVFLAPPRRVVVDDAGDNLLTHAALACDKHAELGGGHLQGDVEHVVQRLAVAYDSIPLFNGLQIHFYRSLRF